MSIWNSNLYYCHDDFCDCYVIVALPLSLKLYWCICCKVVRELSGLILTRTPKLCNFVEWRGYKVVYKRYCHSYTDHFGISFVKDGGTLQLLIYWNDILLTSEVNITIFLLCIVFCFADMPASISACASMRMTMN